jgi:hypothetical protein
MDSLGLALPCELPHRFLCLPISLPARSTLHPFLLVARPLPCGSGDTWRAALRPLVSAPVLVPLGCPSLPNRDAESNAPPPKLSPRSIVRINVHGSKDRAKDASPSACDDLSCLRWVHTLCARMLTAFPSSASFGHPLSSARLPAAVDTAACETDRPRPSFQRPPAKVAVFQKTRMSFTVTTREGIIVAERLLSPAFAPALSLTPPTLCPQVGASAFDWALQGHGVVTHGSVTGIESTSAFVTRWNCHAWD